MNDRDLVQRLCVLAGMAMEDASPMAVSLLSEKAQQRRRTLGLLSRAGIRIAVLLCAAAMVDRGVALDERG